MDAFIFCLWRDRWVLTSAEQVDRGATLLAPPVWIIEHHDRVKLRLVIDELIREEIPVVSKPDYNSSRFVKDLRLEPLGLKNWREFVKDGRCFNLEKKGSKLLLEEWTRDGVNFGASALWQREFAATDTEALVDYVVELTNSLPTAKKQAKSGRRL